jgi:hypothetical protein
MVILWNATDPVLALRSGDCSALPCDAGKITGDVRALLIDIIYQEDQINQFPWAVAIAYGNATHSTTGGPP